MSTTTTMINPCDICGDKGVIEAIITCYECTISCQHLYCMRVVTTEAPPFWLCEECERKKLFSPTTKTDKEQTPKVLIQKDTKVIKSPNKNAFASRFNFKEKRVNTGSTKYISCEEAVKLSSGANQSEQQLSRNDFSPKQTSKSVAPPREKSLVKIYGATKFEPQLEQTVGQIQKSTVVKEKSEFMTPKNRGEVTESIKSTIKSSKRDERTKDDIKKLIEVPISYKKLEKTITQESTKIEKSEVLFPKKEDDDLKVPKSSLKDEKTDMKTDGDKNNADVEGGSLKPNLITGGPVSEMHDASIPVLHSYWKGSFKLPNGHENFNGGFKAHPPSRVHCKVYETLNKMPENINFEFVSIHEIWVDLFQGDCPYKDDIGLYFFPRYKTRFEKCTSLIEFLWSKNLVMKSYVDEVELFVFSSKYLQVNSQEFEGNYFLWGVFRPKKKVKNGISEKSKSKSMVVHESCGQRGEVDNIRSKCADFPPGFEKMKKLTPQG